MPLGNDTVVITGLPAGAIVIVNCFVWFPAALVALTMKVDSPTVVGFPEITPAVERFKFVGNVPLSRVHVMGVSPVAVSVKLYSVPTAPSNNVVVVMVGATGAGPLDVHCAVRVMLLVTVSVAKFHFVSPPIPPAMYQPSRV